MALGERINFFRRKSNMTMKYLGELLGFTSKTADVRISQYETDAKRPKEDLINKMAEVFDVSPDALNVPNIDTPDHLMQTLFALEDIYGLTITSIDDVVCLRLNMEVTKPGSQLWNSFEGWQEKKQQLLQGEITLEEYDDWRYNFPRDDQKNLRAHVYPDILSDDVIEGLKNGDLTIQEAPARRKTRKNFKRKGMPDQNTDE